MIMTQVSKSQLEDWDIPPPLPRREIAPRVHVSEFVPLRLPRWPSLRALKHAWFTLDPKSWHIKPFRRRSLYKLLKRNMDDWWEWLRIDSTPTFYTEISTFRKENDGAVMGVAGPKGAGKSWLSQMLINRCVDTIPHVLFEYRDVEAHIEDKEDVAIGLIIDEDLKATGHESKNLVIHINNAFETSRKAELWAICTGVNLNFKGWGDTLDLRLEPWGYNKKFQATRAAVWTKKRDFLGFIVLQRKHLPEEPVLYYDEEGTWSEYKTRAVAYSNRILKTGGATSAVSAEEQDRHIAAFVDYLGRWKKETGKQIPTNIMCRRLYRKANLPEKSVGYMKEIISWAKELTEDDSNPNIEIKGTLWDGLRQGLKKLMYRAGNTERRTEKAIAYLIPAYPGLKASQVGEELGVGRDAIYKAVSRGLADNSNITKTQLGKLGEEFLLAHLDSSATADAHGSHGPPDILLHPPDADAIAINVKLLFEDPRHKVETTPEDNWMPRAVVATIFPRHHTVELFKITGPLTYIARGNGKQSGLGATGELDKSILEMIEE